ncbi:hypothetical protein EI42_06342 [Thermosporothrix hazakensis]|uniref:Uncharacterized protein n=1 Tax=Thermosporothrix hazakensis TaxID=644383 RepID=A0A326TNT9_THEHA|nr:hypothetical protein [Thermosporothrix hazakensis]PZW18116.1 hypothetical protein EI42_06342 [Thermosporothrix hazakensis]GCE50619.1 hypothetical protein KTH_54880 [Thermosporothrix hazakensis]
MKQTTLSNDAIFALVDQHIFGFEPTCHGPCQDWFLQGIWTATSVSCVVQKS